MSGSEGGSGKPLPSAGLAEDLIPLLRARLSQGGGNAGGGEAEGEAEGEATPSPPPSAPPPPPRPAAESNAAIQRLFDFADQVEAVAPVIEAPARRVRVVTFELDGDEYGVPIECVHEILRVGGITRVPNAPAHVRGVANVRGRLLPVIELNGRLGLGAVVLTKDARIVAVELAGRLLGLLVDRATRVLALHEDEVEPAPDGAIDPQQSYVAGVAKIDERLVMLLDLERALGVAN